MKTKEILTIIAISSLGLCLICSLAKMAMKNGAKGKKHCGKACGAFVILSVILLAVSQLLGEEEGYGDYKCKDYCDKPNNKVCCAGRGDSRLCSKNSFFINSTNKPVISPDPGEVWDFSKEHTYTCTITSNDGVLCKNGKNTINLEKADNVAGKLCNGRKYICTIEGLKNPESAPLLICRSVV